jgi:hypothetical protein
MLYMPPNYLGREVNWDNPPETFQRQRIMRMLNTWSRRLGQLSRIQDSLAPIIKSNVAIMLADWREKSSSRMRELERKHLCLDKTVEHWAWQSSHGLVGQRLRGLDDPNELIEVWREIESANFRLEQMEMLVDANLRRQEWEKAEPSAGGGEMAAEPSAAKEEDGPPKAGRIPKARPPRARAPRRPRRNSSPGT